jgi:hypothetical protein
LHKAQYAVDSKIIDPVVRCFIATHGFVWPFAKPNIYEYGKNAADYNASDK